MQTLDRLKTYVAATAMLCAASAVADGPAADPAAVVRSGNARFTVLTPEMIRIEYSDKGQFEDRATMTVQNRQFDRVPSFTTADQGDWLTITTDRLTLKYRKGSNPAEQGVQPNLTIDMQVNGQPVQWRPGMADPLNLKGTTRTLDGSNHDNKRREMEQGPVSRSGWAVIDDSWSNRRPDGSRSFALEPNATVGYDWWVPRADTTAVDLYFMGYGHDYKRAVGDYTKLAGRVPLPPAYVFGYWYSKYAAYSSADFRQIMQDLSDNQIPADVMILDMDWHWNGDPNCGSKDRGAWTGWSWNTNLIPDAPQLLDDIHKRGLKAALNLHPADGVNIVESPEYYRAMRADLGNKYLKDSTNVQWSDIAWALDYPDFTKSFFSNVIRDHEREGVDFWWLDWQQHLTSHYTKDLGETMWCNHVFYNDMAKNRPDRRPVIFHRWGGLGSHRYQIGFSGDAFINFPTMAFQTYFTPTASNVGYAYWGHDLGGHLISDEIAPNDPELVLRWLQFGVFTPILRTHATKDERIERRIWKFSNFPLMRQAVELRYSLFPYIYTMARETYDTGIGMCRPMYYDHPEAEQAYANEGQYMFGNDILVAPVTEAAPNGQQSVKRVWLPEGQWWSVANNQLVNGPVEYDVTVGMDQIPYFYRAGAIIPTGVDKIMNVSTPHKTIALNTVAGVAGEGKLYEDRGDNADYDAQYATTRFTHTVNGSTEVVTIEPRQGDQAGLPAGRAWQLRLYGAAKPRQVSINGKRTKAWTYDKRNGILTVNIPTTDCGQRVEVGIRN